jgi:lysophospholipase L1-like esterase
MQFTFLALGDSYTIGELVPLHQNFPYQTCQLLRKKFLDEHSFQAPEIHAKTGWTTDELEANIQQTVFLPKYDIVTLLIGVNNQYRGRSVENYSVEFEGLIQQAIRFAGDNKQRVFVLSIPDWGVTPFAEGRDRQQIAKEIDQYNEACQTITQSKGCCFIDITASQREDGDKSDFLTEDKLHHSGNEYSKWAKLLAEKISATIK